VDEMDQSGKPQRGRVLRATDVIPPFDKDAQPPEGGVEIPSYDLAENILAEQRRAAGRRRRGPGRVGAEPAGPAFAGATGPQTHTSALGRGSPTQNFALEAQSPTHASPVQGPTQVLPVQDLLALQRVVAEIVARDVERLCRRPDRSAHVGLS